MTLTNLFRLHAGLAAIYAIGLALVPKVVIGLLSDIPLGAVGTETTRLFGAALVLITLVAWAASRLSDIGARRAIALSLFIYMPCWASLRGHGVPWGGVALLRI